MFEYFKLNPRGKEFKGQIPLPVRLFGVRLQKIEEAQTQSKSEIVNKETQKIKKQVEALPKNSVVIMEAMLHPEGIRGVFNHKEIVEILRLTEKVLAA